jgi:hypothetical protein
LLVHEGRTVHDGHAVVQETPEKLQPITLDERDLAEVEGQRRAGDEDLPAGAPELVHPWPDDAALEDQGRAASSGFVGRSDSQHVVSRRPTWARAVPTA